MRTDDSDLTETGRAAAPLFIDSKRQYAVVSAAWIFRSSRDARSFVGRLIEATNRCGSQGVKSEVGATKSERLVSYGVQHIAGTRDWWNYRVVVTLPVQGRRVKSFVDMGLGQRGRAAAWLVLHGAPAPIPADVEASVVQAVLARMTKQPH